MEKNITVMIHIFRYGSPVLPSSLFNVMTGFEVEYIKKI